MLRSVRTALATSILATSITGAALVVPPAQAQARACRILTGIDLVNGVVQGDRSRFCNPPGEETPLATTIQRRSGSIWVNVTPTGLGSAVYECTDTLTTNTYRIKETFKSVTGACS